MNGGGAVKDKGLEWVWNVTGTEGEFEARFRSVLLSLVPVGVYAGGNKLQRSRERLLFMLALEVVVPTLCPPHPVTCTSTDNRYLLTHFQPWLLEDKQAFRCHRPPLLWSPVIVSQIFLH